jgi:hypothetical protein
MAEAGSTAGADDSESHVQDPNRDTRNPIEHRALWATIKMLPLARLTVALTGIGMIIGLVFGLVSACGADEPTAATPSQAGTGNVNCTGDSACGDIELNISQVQDAVQTAAATAGNDDVEFKKNLRAAPDAAKPPEGSGPYPFVVVDTEELGLFARTTNTMNGVRVGNAGNRALVWANCLTRSDFTPSGVTGENNVGPLWVQVRWKHLEGGQVRGLSEPNENQTAWMYRGGLEPVGHNGDIPRC